VRAVVFSEHGGPEVLRLETLPTPEPGPGEVRIRVGASSLNHLDLWVRRGLPIRIPMPHIGGSDMAGRVEAVGAGVDGGLVGTRVVVDPTLDWEWITGVRRGDAGGAGSSASPLPEPEFRVIGEHTQGAFAEYAVAPVANLRHLPDGVSYETAAAAGLVFVTAWRALFGRGGLGAGERVLVTGGSGGVATAAVQLARHAGAEVFVLTSGEENCRRLEALGAHHAMDRLAGRPSDLLRDATGRRGVDLVVDSVGEVLWETLIRVLAPAGRLVTYGATTGHGATTDLRHVFWKQLSILGTTMGSPADFTRAMELVFRGEVAPVIHSVVPLTELRQAQETLEGGSVFGKIVVVPGGDA
jgi:NADPH:quinone reductase-like Zn-dependent oxidoreductase